MSRLALGLSAAAASVASIFHRPAVRVRSTGAKLQRPVTTEIITSTSCGFPMPAFFHTVRRWWLQPQSEESKQWHLQRAKEKRWRRYAGPNPSNYAVRNWNERHAIIPA